MAKRYLFLKPSSLGDVLHAFPAANAICAREDADADWLIHPSFAELLDYLPFVRRKIFFERKKLGSFRTFLPSFFQLLKSIRSEKYDAVIDFQGLLRSAVIGRLARSSVFAGNAVPKEKIANLFYSRRMDLHWEQPRHALLRNNDLAATFLNVPAEAETFRYSLPVLRKYADVAEDLLRREQVAMNGTIIGIAPGARWKTKTWPPAVFADLISSLGKELEKVSFLLLGSGADFAAGETIRSKLPGFPSIYNLCGKTTIGELVELTRLCDLFISNDSGPMHIAAAVGTPVLAFFGPTFPELTGPFTEKKRVIQPDVPCLRCFKRECREEYCHTRTDIPAAVHAAFELLKGV
mgnify:CR=1 FL=1